MSEYRFINPEDNKFFEDSDKIIQLREELTALLGADIFAMNPLQAQMLYLQKATDLNKQNTIKINLLTINLRSESQIRKLKADLEHEPDNLDLQRRLNEISELHYKAKELSDKLNA